MDSSEAEKKLARLKQEINNLEWDVQEYTSVRDAVQEILDGTQKSLSDLKNGTVKEIGDGLSQALDEESLLNDIEHMKTAIEEYNAIILESNQSLIEKKRLYGEFAHMPAKSNEAKQSEEVKEQATAAVVRQTAVGDEQTAAGAISNLAGSAETSGEGIKSNFKAVMGKVKSFIQNAFEYGAKFVKLFSTSVISVAQKFNVFSGLGNALGGVFKNIGASMKKVFVTEPLTKGMEAIRDAFTKCLGENQAFQTALGSLKTALATAFTPIFNVIIPALTSLLGWLTQIVSAVGRFIAALFGGTASTADENSEALNEEAEAIESTGSAAKGAEGSLASFDEINTIAGPKGGGGGGGKKTKKDTEETEDSLGTISDAYARLKDILLGDGYQDLLEAVKTIGQTLARKLNDMVSSINWYELGQMLGSGLNLALLFLVNFLFTFDWQNLGANLAASINGLVSQIDWYAVGQLLWSGFKIGIETLAGFLLGLDMTQLAQAASNLVIGFFDSISETVQSIDWGQIGHQIADFIFNIDWAGLIIATISMIGDLLWGGVEMIIGFIEGYAPEILLGIGLLIGAIALGIPALLAGLPAVVIAGIIAVVAIIAAKWDEIATYFLEKIEECGGNVALGLLKGIWDVVAGIGEWLYEHIIEPIVNTFCTAFGIHSPSTVMAELGGYLMQGFLGGILQYFSPVIDAIKQIFNGITQFISGVFTGDWASALEGVANIFRGVWNGIVSILEGAVNLIISGINLMISQLNRLQISVPSWLGGGTIGFNIPTIGSVALPRLATGAVIPPNREFLAVLGDQTSGTNIEAPESLIRRIVREESSGGNTALLQEILQAIRKGHVLMVDQKVLASVAVKGINDMSRTAGKTVLMC